MINIQNNRLLMTRPEEFSPVCQRELLWGYECSHCNQPIFGLMKFDRKRDQKAPKEFRLQSKPRAYLHLNRFYPRKSEQYIPPSFEGTILESPLIGMGQLFWEETHFGEFKKAKYGQCKATAVIRPRDRQDLLLRILAAWVKSQEQRARSLNLEQFRRALEQPQFQDMAYERLGRKLKPAADVLGTKPEIYPISFDDFYGYELNNWVNHLVSAYEDSVLR